jgi:hypothetical protein
MGRITDFVHDAGLQFARCRPTGEGNVQHRGEQDSVTRIALHFWSVFGASSKDAPERRR